MTLAMDNYGQYCLDFSSPVGSVENEKKVVKQETSDVLTLPKQNEIGDYYFDGTKRTLFLDTKQTKIDENTAIFCIYFTDSFNKKTFQYKISVEYEIKHTVNRAEVTQAKYPSFPPKFIESIRRREKTEKGKYGSYKKYRIDEQSFKNIRNIARDVLNNGKHNPYVQIID